MIHANSPKIEMEKKNPGINRNSFTLFFTPLSHFLFIISILQRCITDYKKSRLQSLVNTGLFRGREKPENSPSEESFPACHKLFSTDSVYVLPIPFTYYRFLLSVLDSMNNLCQCFADGRHWTAKQLFQIAALDIQCTFANGLLHLSNHLDHKVR